MKKLLLFLLLLVSLINVKSQNPNSVISFNAGFNDTVLIQPGPCGTLTAYTLNIKQNTDYVFQSCPYLPFPFTSPTATELTTLYVDDKYSPLQNLPFNFCFYGQSYNSLVVGSNGIVTFDATNAGTSNSWPLQISGVPQPLPYAGGTQNSAFSVYYPKASVMGAYYDIDPSLASTPATRKIETRIEGTIPNRRSVTSFNNVRVFGSSCTSQYATQQIVVYEGTGVVEVYLEKKDTCPSWNNGLAILGMQNFNRDKAITAPNTNCTKFVANQQGYRFIPSAATSTFRRAQLLCGGTVIATADTSTFNAQNLQLTFNNICPVTDTCTATLRVVYGGCGIGMSGTSDSIVFTKTIFIKRPILNASLTTTNASCPGITDGKITVTASGGTPPITYQLSGGIPNVTLPPQSSNIFNVTNGNYTVTVKDNAGQTIVLNAVVGFNNVISVVTNNDTVICANQPININTTSIGTVYNWQPTIGVNNPNIKNPILTPTVTTQYIVTANLGSCVAKDTINVTVNPLPIVSAGASAIILLNDLITLNATSTAGSYVWTPTTGIVGNPNVLNPNTRPLSTTLYRLTTTNSFGCSAWDTTRITVVPYCIKPMEIFTPNGDGLFDKWLATDGDCTTNITAQVYNRYGALVFEDKNYRNTWDGKYKGSPLPDGTYYFVISFKLLNGKTEFVKGNVTILR